MSSGGIKRLDLCGERRNQMRDGIMSVISDIIPFWQSLVNGCRRIAAEIAAAARLQVVRNPAAIHWQASKQPHPQAY